MPDVKGETLGKLATPLGYDGTDVRPFRIDIDGTLQVKVGTSALPEGGATLAGQTIISDAVLKLTGYALDDVLGATSSSEGAAGTRVVTYSGPLLTASWVITAISAWNESGANNQIILGFQVGTQRYPITNAMSPIKYQLVAWTGASLILPGTDVYADYRGCGLDDVIRLRVVGHKRSL